MLQNTKNCIYEVLKIVYTVPQLQIFKSGTAH